MNQEINIFNTLTRKLEKFSPINEGEVKIYTCGPTVYHYAHIGNLRAYVFADILRRSFVYAGYKVSYVINITDVGHLVGDGNDGEDKMEKGAAREGKSVWDIAQMYTEAFLGDVDLLNIPRLEYQFAKATDNIPEQIELIKKLEEKGFTYKISDGVYFDTSKFAHYADLAKLDIEGLKSGARVEENKEKKNITDFALWKFSPTAEKRQMEWESPWGVGFPGWHIECSAMAMKYLGNHFDIHTGGIDLIPVHHTNEIAQSESATGEHYVNYWMHVNFLNDKISKMSKSLGNFLTLQSLIEKGYSPLAYRYFLLTAHYRSEITFSFEALDASVNAYNKLVNFCVENKTDEGVINEEYKNKFAGFIFDDLNTPRALAVVWDLISDKNISNEDKYKTIISFDEIFGLGLKNVKKEVVEISSEVKSLMEARASARLIGNFAESDRLRDEILKLGYNIKDTANGQEISQK